MNFFIALPVAAAGWYPERIPALPAGLRACHPEDLHLTVAFLGNVGEAQAREAWGATRWPLDAIEIELAGVDPMGPARAKPLRYSALSVVLGRGRKEVEDAIGHCRDAICAAARVTVDARPPKAHVTIARPGRAANESARREGLAWAASVDLTRVKMRLDRLALYGWNHGAGPEAPRYAALEAASTIRTRAE